jgi:hypothetical protein
MLLCHLNNHKIIENFTVYHQFKIFPEGKCDWYQLLIEYQHTVTKLLIYQLLTILNLKPAGIECLLSSKSWTLGSDKIHEEWLFPFAIRKYLILCRVIVN